MSSQPKSSKLTVRPASGWILLARHGEPALSRDIRLNADGYRDWWGRYEIGGIREGQTPPSSLLDMAREADVIFASTRRRAIETAEAVVQGKHFVRDQIFIEAPLPPPPFPAFLKFNPRTWGFLARAAWWFFGHSEDQETRGEAEERAREVARRLIDTALTGQNVLVLAHGFFNTMVAVQLKKQGWKIADGRGYKYWSTRRFVRP